MKKYIKYSLVFLTLVLTFLPMPISLNIHGGENLFALKVSAQPAAPNPFRGEPLTRLRNLYRATQELAAAITIPTTTTSYSSAVDTYNDNMTQANLAAFQDAARAHLAVYTLRRTRLESRLRYHRLQLQQLEAMREAAPLPGEIALNIEWATAREGELQRLIQAYEAIISIDQKLHTYISEQLRESLSFRPPA